MTERRVETSEDWQKALSSRTPKGDHKHSFAGDWPVPGYWRMRYPNKDSGMKPVAIVSVWQIDDGEVVIGDERIEAFVSGVRVAPARCWPYCGRFPISKEEYDDMMRPLLTAAPETQAQERDEMQMQSEAIDLIGAALAKAQGEFKTVGKGHTAKVTSAKGNYTYDYADIGDIMDSGVRDVLAANQIAVVHQPAFEGQSVVMVTRLIHQGQWIAGRVAFTLSDSRPQTLGAIMTYLKRYAMVSMLNLAIADEDADAGDAADSGERVEVQRREPVRRDEAAQNANIFANALAGEIDTATSIRDLEALLNATKNAKALDKLKAEYPDAHSIVTRAEKRRREFLARDKVPA